MYLIKSKDNKEYIVHCTVHSAVQVKRKHSAYHWHWCVPVVFVVFSAQLSQLHLRHILRVFCVQLFQMKVSSNAVWCFV